VIILVVFGKIVQKTTLSKITVIKHLAGISEESLAAIKVITAFTREDYELKKFSKWSRKTKDVGVKFQKA